MVTVFAIISIAAPSSFLCFCLIFRNEEGKQTTISVKDPVDDLDDTDVEDAVDLVPSSNIFDTTGGELVEKVRAEVAGWTVDIILQY